MPIVSIRQRGQLSVRLNQAASGLLQQSSQSVAVHPQLTNNRLGDLIDVLEGSPVDGDTLVYNADLDKYEVRELTVSDLSYDLDGGEF